MDVVHERAAGIDISKRDAKVAVRVPGKRAGSYTTTVKTFGATTAQVFALSDYLLAQRVPTVVMARSAAKVGIDCPRVYRRCLRRCRAHRHHGARRTQYQRSPRPDLHTGPPGCLTQPQPPLQPGSAPSSHSHRDRVNAKPAESSDELLRTVEPGGATRWGF
jgi:hypothetical protein